MQKMKPSYGVGLGNKPPTMGKLMQPIGVVLLFLVSLSGAEDILGKKRAWLLPSGYDNEVGFVKRECRFGH